MAKKTVDPTSRKSGAPRTKTRSVEPPARQESLHSQEDQIRRRAYELFLQRGGHGGNAEEDWLRAEAEVRARAAAA